MNGGGIVGATEGQVPIMWVNIIEGSMKFMVRNGNAGGDGDDDEGDEESDEGNDWVKTNVNMWMNVYCMKDTTWG